MPYNPRRMRVNSGGNIGGILRNIGGSDCVSSASPSSSTNETATALVGEGRQIDLLVFGYACKIFRDDDKAREIDQGKHLISWMSDGTLKIDRYDVRGALYELLPYEAPTGGYGNRLDYLTAEEQRAEQLCEEERYYFLYNSEERRILEQEEELKRFRQESGSGGYNQVGLQYDIANPNKVGEIVGPIRDGFSNSPVCGETDQIFTLPKNLYVPSSIQLPETMRQHAIIEKTARFISSHGVQMEILLKAKQSNNLQFEFLTQNSALYPYYKFILDAVKDGTYPAEDNLKDNSFSDNLSKEEEDISKDTKEDPFSATTVNKPVITVPTIKYKPSANCAYTQLISKIKGVPLPQVIDEHRRLFSSADGIENAKSINTLAVNENNMDNFTPVLLQYNDQTYITEEGNYLSNKQKCDTNANSPPKVEILNNSRALRLAQNYSSDSGSEDDAEDMLKKLIFPIPPEKLRNIIDKTASYVVKNGRQFEETLRSKSEERFTFLLQDNEFYPYYMYKITGDPDAASLEQKTRRAAAVAAALMSKKNLIKSNLGAHVSFSIKSKDDQLQPALPQEGSDEEETQYSNQDKQIQSKIYFQSDIQQRSVPEHVKRAIQLVESQLMARNAQLAAVIGPASCSTIKSSCIMRSRFDLDYNGRLIKPSGSNMSSASEMQRNAIYEQQQQNRNKELKRAEEKVKDKLAQIAREKLGGLISKEKQLQLERKRKAMEFLNQIKVTSENELTPENNQTVDSRNGSANSEPLTDSIPITSYGPEELTDDEGELHYPPSLPLSTPRIFATSERAQKLSPASKSDNSKNLKLTEEVILSDDDDVQLISETKPRQSSPMAVFSTYRKKSKHGNRRNIRSRSHSRSHSHAYDFQPSIRKRLNRIHESSISSDESPEMPQRVKKRSHKFHKTKKSKKNHAKKSRTKSKSKKRSRSQSGSSYNSGNSLYCRRSESHVSNHSRRSTLCKSHSYYSRSESEQSEFASPVLSSKRYRQYAKHNKCSQTPKHKEKRRRHEHLH